MAVEYTSWDKACGAHLTFSNGRCYGQYGTGYYGSTSCRAPVTNCPVCIEEVQDYFWNLQDSNIVTITDGGLSNGDFLPHKKAEEYTELEISPTDGTCYYSFDFWFKNEIGDSIWIMTDEGETSTYQSTTWKHVKTNVYIDSSLTVALNEGTEVFAFMMWKSVENDSHEIVNHGCVPYGSTNLQAVGNHYLEAPDIYYEAYGKQFYIGPNNNVWTAAGNVGGDICYYRIADTFYPTVPAVDDVTVDIQTNYIRAYFPTPLTASPSAVVLNHLNNANDAMGLIYCVSSIRSGVYHLVLCVKSTILNSGDSWTNDKAKAALKLMIELYQPSMTYYGASSIEVEEKCPQAIQELLGIHDTDSTDKVSVDTTKMQRLATNIYGDYARGELDFSDIEDASFRNLDSAMTYVTGSNYRSYVKDFDPCGTVNYWGKWFWWHFNRLTHGGTKKSERHVTGKTQYGYSGYQLPISKKRGTDQFEPREEISGFYFGYPDTEGNTEDTTYLRNEDLKTGGFGKASGPFRTCFDGNGEGLQNARVKNIVPEDLFGCGRLCLEYLPVPGFGGATTSQKSFCTTTAVENTKADSALQKFTNVNSPVTTLRGGSFEIYPTAGGFHNASPTSVNNSYTIGNFTEVHNNPYIPARVRKYQLPFYVDAINDETVPKIISSCHSEEDPAGAWNNIGYYGVPSTSGLVTTYAGVLTASNPLWHTSKCCGAGQWFMVPPDFASLCKDAANTSSNTRTQIDLSNLFHSMAYAYSLGDDKIKNSLWWRGDPFIMKVKWVLARPIEEYYQLGLISQETVDWWYQDHSTYDYVGTCTGYMEDDENYHFRDWALDNNEYPAFMKILPLDEFKTEIAGMQKYYRPIAEAVPTIGGSSSVGWSAIADVSETSCVYVGSTSAITLFNTVGGDDTTLWGSADIRVTMNSGNTVTGVGWKNSTITGNVFGIPERDDAETGECYWYTEGSYLYVHLSIPALVRYNLLYNYDAYDYGGYLNIYYTTSSNSARYYAITVTSPRKAAYTAQTTVAKASAFPVNFAVAAGISTQTWVDGGSTLEIYDNSGQWVSGEFSSKSASSANVTITFDCSNCSLTAAGVYQARYHIKGTLGGFPVDIIDSYQSNIYPTNTVITNGQIGAHQVKITAIT